MALFSKSVYCVHAAVIEQYRPHKFSVACNQVKRRYPRRVAVGGLNGVLVTSMVGAFTALWMCDDA